MSLSGKLIWKKKKNLALKSGGKNKIDLRMIKKRPPIYISEFILFYE